MLKDKLKEVTGDYQTELLELVEDGCDIDEAYKEIHSRVTVQIHSLYLNSLPKEKSPEEAVFPMHPFIYARAYNDCLKDIKEKLNG